MPQSNQEKARWEYLIAQLYEKADKPEAAKDFFERTTRNTFDPVLELYARLNATRQDRSDEKAIADNIEAVISMARKDRYTNYRDIIYFTAATMELERKQHRRCQAIVDQGNRSATGDRQSEPTNPGFSITRGSFI